MRRDTTDPRPIVFCLMLLGVVALLSTSARASAINDCIDACFSSSHCAASEAEGQSYAVCESGRDHCVKQCSENMSPNAGSAPLTGAYGAIAYGGESGAWGVADASQDKDSAERSALGYCKRHAPDCQIVASFSKTCAAVASGTGKRLGWGVNDDQRQAGLEAIDKCGQNGTGNDRSRCSLQLYHCYSD